MKKVIFATAVAGAFMMASCGGGNTAGTTITKGSLSKFDTLSYAVGVNLASMTYNQLADLPLDYDVLVESLVSSATGEGPMSTDDASSALREYFMNKRQARAEEVAKSRDAADSTKLANGVDEAVVLETRRNMPVADAAMFENDEECALISSAMGCDLGNSIKTSGIPAQTVWISKAFEDFADKDLKIDENICNTAIQTFFTVTLPEKNKTESEEWLASIEKQSGVEKTESGILYKIEVAGDDSVKATDSRDQVKVKYTGKTRNGDVFDSSRYADMAEDRKEYIKSMNNGELPADGELVEFPLDRVIPGWTEGMKLVGKGGRISLWIPSELAYGERGAGADIRANEALYFDVELVDVTPFEETSTEE